jgi:hypothetical protein
LDWCALRRCAPMMEKSLGAFPFLVFIVWLWVVFGMFSPP